MTGVWVAAGELSPAKRRLARVGTVATAAGAYAIRERVFPAPALPGADDSDTEEEPVSPEVISKAKLIGIGAGVAVSVAVMVAGHRLEKRWLAALIRDGHAHPYRALAVRMGLISFGVALAPDLIRAREARRSR
ncbi:hypothetical protein BG844_23100 [Couchioplanes caeruleus subsp. caeruleus]|uniref:DUF4235 domain-containing protein n=2 Tax=Couchioplanes caeruleus TaxID=56438 RepID=A0A1K0FGM0_9ACTN|nr:hypothetical protein BG844_23100 [Couchioplanes caeruleus subsp. caeruleus]